VEHLSIVFQLVTEAIVPQTIDQGGPSDPPSDTRETVIPQTRSGRMSTRRHPRRSLWTTC